MEKLLSETEASEVLSLSPRTLEGKRLRGEPPIFVKLGKRIAYRPSDLADYVNANVRTSTSDQGDRR